MTKDGKETTDPGEIADGGVLLPFGGYKGSAIAMMVELLAGALVGDNLVTKQLLKIIMMAVLQAVVNLY